MALASKFKYKARTQEQVEKRLNRTGGSFQGFLHDDYKTFKAAVGDNSVRFLPPTWDDAEHWGYEVHVHYGIGPDRASVICPAKMYNKKCPICEAYAAAKKEGDEEAAKELAPRLQVVSWVVNMKDTSAGPMLWSMGFRMDSDFIKLTRDPESGALLQVDNPEEGFNVHFQRQGTTVKDTRYSGLIVARKPSAIEEAWLEYAVAHPVPSTLVKRDYDEIKALYEGAGSAIDDDDKPAEVKPKAEVADEKPKFQSKVRPKEPEPEPEQAAAEPEQSDTPEADNKPPASVAAATSGMSKADELRAKLAARKAAQAK